MALCITMLVMWIWVLVRNRATAADQIEGHLGVMIGGIVSFVTITTVLVLFTVFLLREIREVRRQDSFIDSMTHELKSPLASVRLALETMTRRDLDPDRREQLRDMALDDVTRLNALIDSVLAASRVGADKGARKREKVNLREMVMQSVRNTARRHHIEARIDAVFDIDIDVGIETVTDPTSLRMVIDNLIDNAIKYSGEEPQISVGAVTRDGRIELEVRDRGIGISKADLRRIFQRFYRAPEEEVRARHGTGLGLYIVSAMVRTLGGKVEAESDGPGEGTNMRVRLPHRLPG